MHHKKHANEREHVPITERAKPLPRSAVQRRPLRSNVHQLAWRERLAAVVSLEIPPRSRIEWAAAADQDRSHIDACASEAEADRKTLRAVDLLFVRDEEFEAIVRALREWRGAMARGEM